MELMSVLLAVKSGLAFPSMILFFGAAIVLTIKTGFLQIRGFGYFVRLINAGLNRSQVQRIKTINAFRALFTAVATSIGIGNVVGPTLAVVVGGPGALFWLVAYMFFASATKFAEVIFGVHFRDKTQQGRILGGPSQYLKKIHYYLAYWYAAATVIVLAIWSGVQANALSAMFAQYSIVPWMSGSLLAILVFIILLGGAKRVGFISSKLLPLMCVAYITLATVILFSDIVALQEAFRLIGRHIFSPTAAVSGFLGSAIFTTIQEGTYRSVLVSEAGVGFAAIPQSLSDVQKPYDQGVLTMFSMLINILLCMLSGLLAITTGLWHAGFFSPLIVYQAFQIHYPTLGPLVYLVSVSLFIFTSIIGNGLNGSLCFAVLTRYRWIAWYYVFVAFVVLWGATNSAPLVWIFSDAMLPLVAIPHLIGLLILTFSYPRVLKQN